MSLSHLDAEGRARMVDVGAKAATARDAVAEGVVRMSAEAFAQAFRQGELLDFDAAWNEAEAWLAEQVARDEATTSTPEAPGGW